MGKGSRLSKRHSAEELQNICRSGIFYCAAVRKVCYDKLIAEGKIIQFQQIIYFLKIVKLRGINKAADGHCVSQRIWAGDEKSGERAEYTAVREEPGWIFRKKERLTENARGFTRTGQEYFRPVPEDGVPQE